MELFSMGSWSFSKSSAVWAALWLSVSGMIGAGCSGGKEAARQASFSRVQTPQPPAFLTGPTSLLLTNWAGFSARIEVQASSILENSSGQLLGQGSKLLYAPHSGENTDTKRQPGGYSFIWDVAQGSGYVLSDALQGYAPVSAELRVTHVDMAPSTGPLQRYSGHPCEPATATIHSSDSETHLELFRATDLHGFPVRIQARDSSSPVTLSFSNVRFESVSEKIFAPPDGFTQYRSPQAMADELAARQNNLHRRSSPLGSPIPELEQRRY